MSDSEDSDLEENPVSKRVGNIDWCRCEVCVSRSERKCTCCSECDILEEKLETVDCVTKHMDSDVTCLDHSVLATSYVAFMRCKCI